MMSTNPLLEPFREAYRNLEQLPLLTDKELDQFRIEYGEDEIADLRQSIEDSPSGNSKIVFVGHRGSGKSTLLAEFCRRIKNDYFVVFFSIAKLIEMADINHISILFAIALEMMKEAEVEGVQFSPKTKESLSEWFATITQTKIEEKGGEITTGFDLWGIITGKLKADSVIRREIKQEFERKVVDLVAKLNQIASVIYGETGREIVVVIDDLDKIGRAQAEDIFLNHIKALFQPNFRMIITVPIAVMRDIQLQTTLRNETNNQIVQLSVIKLFDKKDKRSPERKLKPQSSRFLEEILLTRIRPELVEPEAITQAILASGGVLSELIRIGNQCCQICLKLVRRFPEDDKIKINSQVMAEALNEIKLDYAMPLGSKDYQILAETYQNFIPQDTGSQDFLTLLHGLYVLEYRNAELWYDVHPLVLELLQGKGLI